MAKVLIKHRFDMCDADYVYGVTVMDKDDYAKYTAWVKEQGEISKFCNEMESEHSAKTVLGWQKVFKLTDEEAALLKKLDLIEFGEELPGWGYYEDELDEDEDD